MAKPESQKPIPEAPLSPLPAMQSGEGLWPAFLDAVLADFAAHGAEAIRRCREDSPATYLKICAGLLPKQLKIESANDLDDAELDERIRRLAARLAIEIGAGGPPDGEAEAEGAQPSPGLPAVP